MSDFVNEIVGESVGEVVGVGVIECVGVMVAEGVWVEGLDTPKSLTRRKLPPHPGLFLGGPIFWAQSAPTAANKVQLVYFRSN